MRTGTRMAAMHSPPAKRGAVMTSKPMSLLSRVECFSLCRTEAISGSSILIDRSAPLLPIHNAPSFPTTTISSNSPDGAIQVAVCRSRILTGCAKGGVWPSVTSSTAACMLITTALPSAALYCSKSLSVTLMTTKLVRIMAPTRRRVKLSRISVLSPGLKIFKVTTRSKPCTSQ